MPVSPDTGIKVLGGAGETLTMESQNAACLQEWGLAQQGFSGLGQLGPHGNGCMQRPFTLHLMPSLPAGFLHAPDLFPVPKAASTASLTMDLWLGMLFLSLSWVPWISRAALEVLLCTDSRTLSQTFSVCLSCLWEKQHQEMRLLQGTTIFLSLSLGNWYGQSLKVKWSQPK